MEYEVYWYTSYNDAQHDFKQGGHQVKVFKTQKQAESFVLNLTRSNPEASGHYAVNELTMTDHLLILFDIGKEGR